MEEPLPPAPNPAPPKSNGVGEKSPNEKLVEDVLQDIPFGTAVKNFFVREGKAVKSGWLAFVIFSCIALCLGREWRLSGRDSLQAQIDELKRDNQMITQNNQLLSQKNGDLELTIAPLIARAAKEFPGEEINESLKKIVSELAARDPLSQAIATGTANVSLKLSAGTQKNLKVNNGTYMMGAFAALGVGNSAVLASRNSECFWSITPDQMQGELTTTCQSPPDSPYMGKPISSLKDARYIQIDFGSGVIPDGSQITGGSITWTINSSINLTFVVPPGTEITKTPQGASQVIIQDLSEGLKPLLSTPDKSTSQL